MEATNNEKRKSASSDNQPVQVIRKGAIAASSWRRQSPAGFAYYDYSISRSWKSLSTGRTGYSSNFFRHHEAELLQTIAEASAWIDAHSTEDSREVAKETLAA